MKLKKPMQRRLFIRAAGSTVLSGLVLKVTGCGPALEVEAGSSLAADGSANYITVKDIQGSSADGFEHQRLRQSKLVNDLAPSGIDQESVRLHQIQHGGIDRMPVRRAPGTMQGDEIALRKQIFDAVDLRGIALRQYLWRDGTPVLDQDFHTEAMVRAFGHLLTDAAKSDDAQLFS